MTPKANRPAQLFDAHIEKQRQKLKVVRRLRAMLDECAAETFRRQYAKQEGFSWLGASGLRALSDKALDNRKAALIRWHAEAVQQVFGELTGGLLRLADSVGTTKRLTEPTA